jgi:rSAM/selenodomain-associated transferase 1
MLADRLLIFAQFPAADVVRTWFEPELTRREVAELYDASLRDVITLAARERGRLELWFNGGDAVRRYFEKEFSRLVLVQQVGGSLGQRLVDAFERSFTDGAERVIVIFSDSPTLPETMLTSAFHDLHEADAVLGPTFDGGYYLVGLRRLAWLRARRMFEGVAWSTAHEWETSLVRAQDAKLAPRILPGWYHIDSTEDMVRARLHARADSHLGRWLAGRGARLAHD